MRNEIILGLLLPEANASKVKTWVLGTYQKPILYASLFRFGVLMTEMSRQESDMQKVVSQTVTCSHNVGVQMMRRSIQIK